MRKKLHLVVVVLVYRSDVSTIKGVVKIESGYSGGEIINPTL